MLKEWSNRFVDILLDNKIIKKNEKEIYAYGFHIIISSMIGVLLMAFLGLILNR